jgi:hypothetical protein
VPLGLIGIALVAHGAHRIRQIRVARRALDVTPTFDVSRRSVGLQIRF